MTALRKQTLVSVEEYLEREIVSDQKHEYLGGEIHAMAGAGNRHNEIATNVTASLAIGLRGNVCRAFNSDTKVRIELARQTRFYYPDAMVVCEKNKDTDHWQDQPVVIAEVLSDSTRRTDLSGKRDAYLTIPSLNVLIFVEPDERSLTVYRRGGSGEFEREEYSGSEAVLALSEIGTNLALSEVYEGLEF